MAFVKNPSLWKENKVSSRAEDDDKSAEVGTHEVGHRSDLSRGQSSMRVGTFWKQSVILCSDWYNITQSLM